MRRPQPARRLLGRSTELEAVREQLARGRERGCDVVLIEGEAGIGKTRLLEEVLADAAGLRLFRACAEELEQTRPFGSLADALDCRLSSDDPLCAEIARLIDEAAVEFRIVERFADVLERRALEGPLLVVIDDLHWADPSTVTSLRFAVRRLADVPVAFVLAFRPFPRSHELDRFANSSVREGALHVTLGPLDEAAVAELVEDRLGDPPGPGLRSLVASAAGNPFYVTELIDTLAADGRVQAAEGIADVDAVSVPVAFRSAVIRHLQFLDGSRLSLLRWAAVLDGHFSLVDLATVSGTSIDSALPVVEEAVTAGVLVPDGDRFAFHHDLLRETLYEDMGGPVRRSLHLAAGRALATAGNQPLQIAHHLMRGPATRDDMAVESLLAATRQAIDLGTRAELLAAALERLPPHDPRTVKLAAQAIDCLGRAGRATDAEALVDRLRADLDHDDVALLGAALVGVYAQQTDPDGVLRHCDTVRNHLPAEAPVRPGLLANEGFALLQAGRVDDAESAARSAIEAGTRLGTSGAVNAGRALLCLCALASGRGRDAADLAAETAKTWPSDFAKVVLQMALLNEDRLTEADELLRSAQDRIVEAGHLTVAAPLQANSGLALLLRGRLDDAQAQAEAALALAEQAHVPVITSVARGVIARVAVHRGSVAEAEAALGSEAPGAELGRHFLEWARALTCELKGDPAGARQVLHSAWERFSPLRYIISWSCVGPELVRLHLAVDDRELAASVAATVEAGAAGSDAPSATGAALRCRALVENDPALMGQAVAAYERGPRSLETARTREDCAALLSGTAAVDHLRAALAVYEETGADGDATRVRAALRERGIRIGARGARRRPVAGWDSLTPTEQKVVALVVEGLTSRQIGERLYISGFTVGSHLRHVYQKLGINSRVLLTTEAMRHQAS